MLYYPKDPIVQSVLNRIKDRADRGMHTYGVPMTRTDLSTIDWLRHLQEELLDAALYVERIISDLSVNKTKNLDLPECIGYGLLGADRDGGMCVAVDVLGNIHILTHEEAKVFPDIKTIIRYVKHSDGKRYYPE